MKPTKEHQSMVAIGKCRNVQRRVVNKLAAEGVTPSDISISFFFTALDIASTINGGAIGGIEWMRTALDQQERVEMGSAQETRQ